MRGLPSLSSISSFFRNIFNKFNNIRGRILDSIYYMTLRLLWNLISGVKTYNFVIMYATLLWPVNLKTTGGLSILLHGVISLPDVTSFDK